MPTEEYTLWSDIQDIVGPASFCPNKLDAISGHEICRTLIAS